jgi:hypothetical protein
LKGGTGKKLHKATLDELRASDAPILLLAAGAYLGEGFDLPELDTLFQIFASSGGSRVVNPGCYHGAQRDSMCARPRPLCALPRI